MNLGVDAYPSGTLGPHDPGHASIYWQLDELEFRGFRFNPADLPENFQDPATWKSFLFENTLPGYIRDDPHMKDLHMRGFVKLLGKTWIIEDAQLPQLVSMTQTGPHGRYSFNPDTHQCNNCVTWAIRTINVFVQNGLSPVREGRLKLFVQQLRNEHEND